MPVCSICGQSQSTFDCGERFQAGLRLITAPHCSARWLDMLALSATTCMQQSACLVDRVRLPLDTLAACRAARPVRLAAAAEAAARRLHHRERQDGDRRAHTLRRAQGGRCAVALVLVVQWLLPCVACTRRCKRQRMQPDAQGRKCSSQRKCWCGAGWARGMSKHCSEPLCAELCSATNCSRRQCWASYRSLNPSATIRQSGRDSRQHQARSIRQHSVFATDSHGALPGAGRSASTRQQAAQLHPRLQD